VGITKEQQERFRQLRALDEEVRATILGHPVQDRYELQQLQDRVHEEIRNLKISMLQQLEQSATV